MPYRPPTLRQLTQDRVSRAHQPAFLQSVSIGFSNPSLIAERLAPTIPVNKQSDLYRVWGRNMLRTHESTWAPGTVPNALDARWSSDSYYAAERKLRIALTDSERANQDDDLALQQQYTEVATNAIDIGREARVATLFTTAANYSSSHKITKSGGSEYDQTAVIATAQILIDMQAMISQVSLDCAVPKDQLTVVIPQTVWDQAIQNNTAIIARIQYVALGMVTIEPLQKLLGVKEIIIAQSFTSGAGPEVADSDVISGYQFTYLWKDFIWIGLVNAGAQVGVPWFARTFRWSGATNGQDRRVLVYRDKDEGTEQDWIEVKEARGEKIALADAGALLVNCLSTI